MSISNLLHPNDYNVFCNTLTTTAGAQSFRATNVPMTLGGTGTPVIASYSIHGIAGALPAVMPYIDYTIIASGIETVIHVTIPYFDILTVSGTTPTVNAIQFVLPANITPTSTITSGTVAVYNGTSTQVVAQSYAINTGSIQLHTLNSDLFYTNSSPSFFGLHNADLCITYTIPG